MSALKMLEKNFALEKVVQLTISRTIKKAVPAILSVLGLAVSGPLAALIGLAASIFPKFKSRRGAAQ